jgi:hypothetical protein
MARVQLTPQRHHIFNNFDRDGLLLDLPRISGERNAAYKRRLFDVCVNRGGSSYRGLINAVTRELGLEIVETLRIQPVVDSDGSPLVTMPAIVFENTKCYLYNDFANDDVLLTIDRFDMSGDAWSISELISVINETGRYTATLLSTGDGTKRSMTIFNQSSIKQIASEDISNTGGRVDLEHNNLIQGSVGISSSNLKRRVSSQADLRINGDYYIDLEDGILYIMGHAFSDSVIRYQYRDDNFLVYSSPVIIHNLQSEDFKTKMFHQVEADDGSTANGAPTPLGADIINELLSVFPVTWGV